LRGTSASSCFNPLLPDPLRRSIFSIALVIGTQEYESDNEETAFIFWFLGIIVFFNGLFNVVLICRYPSISDLDRGTLKDPNAPEHATPEANIAAFLLMHPDIVKRAVGSSATLASIAYGAAAQQQAYQHAQQQHLAAPAYAAVYASAPGHVVVSQTQAPATNVTERLFNPFEAAGAAGSPKSPNAFESSRALGGASPPNAFESPSSRPPVVVTNPYEVARQGLRPQAANQQPAAPPPQAAYFAAPAAASAVPDWGARVQGPTPGASQQTSRVWRTLSTNAFSDTTDL
jgi:hypothetical protein